VRLLVVTAVAGERDAVAAAVGDASAVVLAGGIGPASSAAHTSAVLAADSYDLVLSAGIAGGFPVASARGSSWRESSATASRCRPPPTCEHAPSLVFTPRL